MPINLDFLKLPWEIQAALASGYVAYMIAYAGLKGRHSAIDTAFITLVFSLIATLVLFHTSRFGPLLAIPAAFVGCCAMGLIWRKWGRSGYRAVLRKLNVSWSNDDPTALDTLCGDSSHYLTAVAVQLDDGRWLRCDDTDKFRDSPHGPALIDPNGDIAFYLTHEDATDGTSKEQSFVQSKHYGDQLTYVPAARVRMMNLRYQSSVSRSVKEAVEASAPKSAVEP